MIKPNELRIGQTYMSVKFKTPVTFTAEHICELVHAADGADISSYIDEMFRPIMLTEDWLVRFGFEKDGYDYWNSTQKYFELGETEHGYVNSINCYEYRNGEPIQYVHQLQNLYFSLTQTELEIKQSKP
jgi:hypothetical protein